MSDCLFCKIRDGQIPAAITYRDEDVLAFKDINPRAPFHQLVVPLKHISTLGSASADEAELLGKIVLAGAHLAKEAGYTDSGYRVVMNAGKDAGQTVFHIHLHVLAGRALGWPPG
ncbi:MAG TPA: histidine triad nucleotide-binding protein [Polyangia bacterium]|nr:histidine triad nucleotide-binding protein [Polyangia bacterium]